MSEWGALSRRLRERLDRGVPVALATVVATEGSAYRRPGAWMLVDAGGGREGLVSGGCLEADVALRAERVLESGRPELALYDTRLPDDLLWGFGVGCSGVVRIWIEPLSLSGDGLRRAAEFFEEAARCREDGIMATALSIPSGGPGAPAAARALVTSSRIVELAPGGLSEPVLRRARERLAGDFESGVETIDGCEISFARAAAPVRLLLCGAGDDAVPLARLGVELDWSVLIVDHRPAFARPDRFPGARVELVTSPSAAGDLLRGGDSRTAAVVLTHNLERDIAWTAALLPLELGYLGILGPRRRGEQVVETARSLAGAPPKALAIAAPVGLDTAAETPAEIAVSIVAEISAVLSGRDGRPLSRRDSPIHPASVPAPAPALRREP